MIGLWVEKFILPVMAIVLCTFIIIIGILFGSCRPYPRMWQFYSEEGGKSSMCSPKHRDASLAIPYISSPS